MSKHPFAPIIVEDNLGQLFLTPCPGTKEVDLSSSLQQLAEAGAKAILTLMPAEEIERNEVGAMPVLCKKLGLQWFHLPIEDDHAPEAEFHEAWQQTKIDVHELISAGKSIAIHCKGGSGRTGMVAAQILLERGIALDNVIARVQAARPTALRISSQVAYVKTVAKPV